MKTLKTIFAAGLVLISHGLFAQADNNDTEAGTHPLVVTVPTVIILDVYDAATDADATTINFDMADVMVSGTNKEAGIYNFNDVDYTGLWLNYTSVIANGGLSRKITVEYTGTLPPSVDLRVTPVAPVLEAAANGTTASAGSVVAAGVVLGETNAAGVVLDLVTSIESVYTGDETFGVALTYTLEQNGNFADYEADTYNSDLIYTLTEM